MQVERVLVVGGGLMGSGIAQVIARAGLDVTVVRHLLRGPLAWTGGGGIPVVGSGT
jgi:flavin-dependent dehydrogenase